MTKQKEPPCKKEVELAIGPETIYAAEFPVRGTKRTFQIQLVLINHNLGYLHNLFAVILRSGAIYIFQPFKFRVQVR